MKVLILGATGRTGKHVLAEILDKGHEAHCLVRNKSKVELQSDKLTLFEGTPVSTSDLEKAMAGCSATISVLNVARKSDFPWAKLTAPKDLMSSAIRNVIALSDRIPMQRIVVCSAAGAGETRSSMPGWFNWLVNNSNIRYAYEDHDRQEQALRDSDLKWTIVRPTGLSNNDKLQSVIETYDGKPRPSWSITRRTVARYMSEALERDDLIGKAPILSGRP